MSFSLSNRALLRGMLAGAVVLTGTACSRSDRSESGRDNSAAETAPASDKDAAGYRSMERETTNVLSQHSDSARVTADTADASSVSSDTPTSETLIGADTDVSAEAGVAVADTTGNAGRIRPPEDSTEILGQVSPEDSTEILGNVTTDEAVDETADEQVVRPEDRETVAESETRTDEVGAAAVAGDVTGAEAVALMNRQGVRCAVVDPEGNEAVRWDMSNTPVTLNPCGMGSMNLSRIWTVGSGGQE